MRAMLPLALEACGGPCSEGALAPRGSLGVRGVARPGPEDGAPAPNPLDAGAAVMLLFKREGAEGRLMECECEKPLAFLPKSMDCERRIAFYQACIAAQFCVAASAEAVEFSAA